MSCHLFGRVPDFQPNPATQLEIDRVFELWQDALDRSGGPFLFGRFGIADAMFYPVRTRFRTYGVPIPAPLRSYVDALDNLPAVRALEAHARHAPAIPAYDAYLRELGGDPVAALAPDDRHARATALGTAALQQASQNPLAEATATYREAVRLAAECDHRDLADYRVQLGQVLARAGDREAALAQFQQGLLDALGQNEHDETSPSVGIVRYFMSEFLVSTDQCEEALRVLAPALEHARSLEGVLRMVEAEALWLLNRQDESRRSAARALALAKSDGQRERMEARLKQLAGWSGAS
jgi:tetratricopeptide (TPR) repeat protein